MLTALLAIGAGVVAVWGTAIYVLGWLVLPRRHRRPTRRTAPRPDGQPPTRDDFTLAA